MKDPELHPSQAPATSLPAKRLLLACLAAAAAALGPAAQAATNAPVSGEIQFLTLDTPGDHWSGGRVVVGGQTVILPRNLLLDLPANRLTLAQLFAEAPATCLLTGESGLARGDACNTSGQGGWVDIAANRSDAGNVIAGDVLLSKGLDAITGTVTYVDHTDGYFRLNGIPGDAATGTMVRLNDPDARHTIQQGAGCAGGPNCSADPRFTLDGDNYINVFSTGFPFCIPSTVERPVPASLGLAAGTARALADGSGDALCPLTNRTVNGGQPVDDSRRFAPVLVGDSLTAEGNFETVAGVRFLSAHSTMIKRALTTKPDPAQPDYLFLDEVEVDAPGFQNQRARTLIIGYSTLAPSDVLIWSLHYDPGSNSPHEFPLATVQGCDTAAGAGTCGQQGLVGTGNAIFKIRHDVDFLAGAKPRLNPCAHLLADPRFPAGICPRGGATESNTGEMFAILSPMMREIQARTGHELANPGAIIAIDVSGNPATHGQYLFPFGMNLGGVSVPEFNEINLDALGTPFLFSGLPWAMDRRLSPGGCIDTDGDGLVDCEATPQPLDPFPYEGLDPRTQAGLPLGSYFDTNFTASQLSRLSNRILSYVSPSLGTFNGDGTLLAWPPAPPAAFSIAPTPEVSLVCTAPPPPPPSLAAVDDAASTVDGVPVVLLVLANDSDPLGGTLSVTAVTSGANGLTTTDGTSVTFTPAAGFVGVDSFSYTVSSTSGATGTATVTVTVDANTNAAPVALADGATTTSGAAVVIPVLDNDSDADGDPLSVVAVTAGSGGTTSTDGTSVSYTPTASFSGTDTFQYTVSDGLATATATVTVTVTAPETLNVALAFFRISTAEWRVEGTTSVTSGATITIHNGSTLAAPVLATVVADAAGVWRFRQTGSATPPDLSRRVSVESSGGATRLNLPVTVRQ
jgi:Big-like domain-containing protein